MQHLQNLFVDNFPGNTQVSNVNSDNFIVKKLNDYDSSWYFGNLSNVKDVYRIFVIQFL